MPWGYSVGGRHRGLADTREEAKRKAEAHPDFPKVAMWIDEDAWSWVGPMKKQVIHGQAFDAPVASVVDVTPEEPHLKLLQEIDSGETSNL